MRNCWVKGEISQNTTKGKGLHEISPPRQSLVPLASALLVFSQGKCTRYLSLRTTLGCLAKSNCSRTEQDDTKLEQRNNPLQTFNYAFNLRTSPKYPWRCCSKLEIQPYPVSCWSCVSIPLRISFCRTPHVSNSSKELRGFPITTCTDMFLFSL